MKLLILLLLVSSNSFAQYKKVKEINGIKVPKGIIAEYDSIDRITKYQSKSTSPNIYGDMWTPIQLMINHKDGNIPELLMKIKYRGSDWIFANKVKLVFDTNQMDLVLSDRITSVDNGNINEIYYVRLENQEIKILKEYLYVMSKKSKFSMRLYGQSGYVNIPGGISIMGGVTTRSSLLKNSIEMTAIMKLYDQLTKSP